MPSSVFSILCLLSMISLNSFAGAPVHGCRVSKSVIEKYGQIASDAGCVIAREGETGMEILMTYVDKTAEGKGKGWGFPAGKSSTRENDLEESKSLSRNAKEIPFEYAEPAVCTASRETREEAGFEVVVKRLIERSESFAAFECVALDKKNLLSDVSTSDEQEVKDLRWIAVSSLMGKSVKLRYEEDLTTIKKFVELVAR